MKKTFISAVLAALSMFALSPNCAAEDISAKSAIVYEPFSATVLYEKNADERALIASTTKIMTALVVLENCALGEKVSVSASHAAVEGSSMYLKPGGDYTVEQLLLGLMLASGNDAAAALAEHTGGSIEGFAAMMNDKCRALELSAQASFTNTSGLFDSAHTCTLRDMAAIMRAAMANDLCREILTTDIYVTAPTDAEPEGLTFQNKYLGWFLEKQPEGAAVSACKSGYVAQALNCLVSYGSNAEGRNFICVIARAANAETMMGDHRILYSTYGK